MPRHGRLWRWSDTELLQAEIVLRQLASPSSRGVTFTNKDVARAATAITGGLYHGHGLRMRLLTTGRMVIADDSDRRQYLYRLKGTDGEQAQRPAPPAD